MSLGMRRLIVAAFCFDIGGAVCSQFFIRSNYNRLIRISCGVLIFCPYNTPWDVLEQKRGLNCCWQLLESRVKKTRIPP